MADTLELYGIEYEDVTGFKAKDDSSNTLTYIRPQGTKSITANGTGIDVSSYASVDVAVSGGTPTLETITKTYAPSTSAITDTITASSGYDGIEEVDVTVSAVPLVEPFVGFQNNEFFNDENARKWWHIRPYTEVDSREGDTPGYYADGTDFIGDYYETFAIASGTAVTPTESAQTIGGARYMMEGAVTVNAIPSDYVGSGIARQTSLNGFEEDGSYWVEGLPGYYPNYVDIEVPSGTAGTPTATKGSVNNHSISVTPSVTNSTGYITGGTKTGTAVLVSASELVSGSQTLSDNGDYDVTNLASVTVAMPSMTLPSEVSPASVGTSKAQISAGSTTSYLNIPTGYNGASQFYEVMPLSSVAPVGGLSVSAYGIYSAFTYDLYGFDTVTVPSASLYDSIVVGGSITFGLDEDRVIAYVEFGSSVSVVSSAGYINTGETVILYGNYNSQYTLPTQSLPTSATTTYTGTNVSNVFPSTATRYINIPTGYASASKYYTLLPYDVAPLSVSENGTYSASTYDLDGFSTVTVNVSGGGTSEYNNSGANKTLTSASNSITFENLLGEPTSFCIMATTELTTGASPWKTAMVVYDGTNVIGQTITNTSNAQVSYDSSGFSKSYSNGTLTVTGTGTQFQATTYYLTYSYGGTAANIGTADVQVGSGATSITFTGLEDEPDYWSCIFKSNFSTSSGYQRVIGVYMLGGDIYGLEMDSSAKFSDSHWSSSYSNGSLTITSSGTNAGGYFHQPGYYQLTYGISGDQSMQTKTVTPTTSVQNVTADTGYTGLKKVVVNAIPSSYVQPTSTVGSTTYRASTSNQTINAGTYHSAAATIAAVSQTNLTAENIKSGTTISISNGQSNLWSVTGSYTGGGGSANFGTVTMSNSSNQAQSINFTLPSGRTPKAFFARLTTQITRNSSSRYYYVENMRWDGSATGGVAGRCFYMSSGQLTNITSGYSYSQSGTTFTLTTTGSRSASPGSFYNGTYELVYVY